MEYKDVRVFLLRQANKLKLTKLIAALNTGQY